MSTKTKVQLQEEISELREMYRDILTAPIHVISVVFGGQGELLHLLLSEVKTTGDLLAMKSALSNAIAQVDRLLLNAVRVVQRKAEVLNEKESIETSQLG